MEVVLSLAVTAVVSNKIFKLNSNNAELLIMLQRGNSMRCKHYDNICRIIFFVASKKPFQN